MQIKRIFEVPPKSESRGFHASGDSMRFGSWLGRGPGHGIETSLQRERKKEEKKSESDCEDESGFFSSKKETLEPRQGWGDKLG